MTARDNENKIINLALVIGQLTFGGAEKQQLYEMVIRLDRNIFNPIVFCLSEVDMPYGDKLRKQNKKHLVDFRRGVFIKYFYKFFILFFFRIGLFRFIFIS